MNRVLLASIGLVLFLFQQAAAMAEDIDVFVSSPRTEADLPALLVVFDNGSNFSASSAGLTCQLDGDAAPLGASDPFYAKAGIIEKCAFYNVIRAIPTGPAGEPLVKIGMMGFNGPGIVDINGQNCNQNVGGCLMYPFTPISGPSAADATGNKQRLLDWIRSWKPNGSGIGMVGASGDKTGAAMQEAWAYYAGKTGISGRKYTAPSSGCGKNYVVYVANALTTSGTPADSASDKPGQVYEGTSAPDADMIPPIPSNLVSELKNNRITTSFPIPACLTGSTSGSTQLSNHQNSGWYLDEYARYMRKVNGITTYSIGVINPANCKKDYPALLTSTAKAGGGKYFQTSNTTELTNALKNVIAEVQSVNTVFASVSLPVSVNPQGTLLNQVFIGMFRPDSKSQPRWYGNLKQYRLGLVGGGTELSLLDADSNSAISSGNTGFIAECARSEWTPKMSDTYWERNVDVPDGGYNCPPYSSKSNFPDGNLVEKGAQAYTNQDQNPVNRKVFLCNDSSCSSLSQLGASPYASAPATSITKTLLGNTSMAEGTRVDLINWMRGLNNNLGTAGETDFGVAVAMRPSAHGDVVHSRPVALNYGTDASPQVVVFYGANDGMLRAINGNRDSRDASGNPDPLDTTDNIGGIEPGHEMWSFMPFEFYNDISRLRDNTITIYHPLNTSGTPMPQPKSYGLDGPLSAYQGRVNGTDRELIFGGLRRGGRAVYAFDVSTPASPSLLWRVGCDESGANCTSGFTAIGQTWSPVTAVKAKGYMDSQATPEPKPIVMFGGGYDTCHDSDTDTACSAASIKGNRIFILDATTGTKLGELMTDSSVTGGVTIVPDADGYAKYAYTADLAGNVYRIGGQGSDASAGVPFGTTAPETWTITKLASLGGSGTSNRKFQFAPDILSLGSESYAILLGSGDREKPVLTGYPNAANVKNYFFMLKDRPTTSGWLTSENSNCSASRLCLASLTEVSSNFATSPPDSAALSASKGWYLQLVSGEQVVTSAITVNDVVTFSTQQPATASSVEQCQSNLGTTNVYNIKYLDAGPAGTNRFEQLVGGGLPPSPVAGKVILDDGTVVPFVIGGSEVSALKGDFAPSPKEYKQSKGIPYWQIER